MKGVGISFILLLLLCCGKRDAQQWEGQDNGVPHAALAEIDSLMWQQPDSALACLLPCFDTCCRDAKFCVSTATAYNRHYANLLLSELLYKNDYAQVNRAELLQAVAYFDSLVVDGADTRGVSQQARPRRDARRASAQNIAFLDARAHYINGVGYYENDSAVSACKEYLKALEVMEGCFEEEELVGKKAQFMALTYTHLTGLFADLYLHEQAIYFGHLALSYYHKFDATLWHVAWMLNTIGSQFEITEQLDSASYYYEEAAFVLDDTNLLLYRDIVSHQILSNYKINHCFETSLARLKKMLSLSQSDKEYLARCAVIGEIYYHENQFDSAQVYLNKVFQESKNENLRKQDAELLVEIFKVQGRNSEIFEYTDFLVPFATRDENQGIIKSQLAELYNGYKQFVLEQQHRQKIKKQSRLSVIVVSGLLIAMLSVFALNQTNKNKKQSLEALIKAEQYAHEIMQKALSSRLKQSNEALRLQKKEANNLVKVMETKQKQVKWGQLDDFMKEDICNDIVTMLRGKQIKREAKSGDYPELHLSDVQLHDLSVAVEKQFCGFERTLTDLYPKINRNAMNQCLLYLLDLEDVQIAALLSCDYSTVKRRSTKLKQVFGTEKELRQFIREFVS